MNPRPYLAVLATAWLVAGAEAAPIDIVNHSFEVDPTGPEFFLGDPTGWTAIDPTGIIDAPTSNDIDVVGTLDVTVGGNNFGGVAPDGNRVGIIFIGEDTGAGEVGLGQVLTEDLASNTRYTLTVEVGNIDSASSAAGDFFDLGGFPGYRLELLAGGSLLASLEEGVDALIGEGVFATRELVFDSGAAPVVPGQALEIRLYNLNLSDPAVSPLNPPAAIDLEVDFDNVRLDATRIASVPAPATLALVGALVPLVLRRRRGTPPRRVQA